MILIKDRQNEFVVLEVRMVVTLGRKGTVGTTLAEDSSMLVILYLLTWGVLAFVSPCYANS